MIGVGHDGNLLSLGQAAGPYEIRHDHVRRALFQNVAEGVARDEALADAMRNPRFLRQPQQILRAVRLDHVLHPHDVVGLQRPADTNGVVQVPPAVPFDHDFHLIADAVADALDALEAGLQVALRQISAGVTGRQPPGRSRMRAAAKLR